MRSSIKNRINEAGRQVNAGHRQPKERAKHRHGVWLSQHKDDIYYRWRYRGHGTRQIARQCGALREQVEAVIRERVIANERSSS